MVTGTTGFGDLDTTEGLNRYISNNHNYYRCCQWALEINPNAGKCWRDCPFPYCVMAYSHPTNKNVRPVIVEQIKNGQNMLKQCDLVR